MEKGIRLTVTVRQLDSLASCARRMVNYSDSSDLGLITSLRCDNGITVKLCLNKQEFSRPPPERFIWF